MDNKKQKKINKKKLLRIEKHFNKILKEIFEYEYIILNEKINFKILLDKKIVDNILKLDYEFSYFEMEINSLRQILIKYHNDSSLLLKLKEINQQILILAFKIRIKYIQIKIKKILKRKIEILK